MSLFMTPPDLIERHVSALLAVLRSDSQLSPVVFEGTVTGTPQRYVNVFHDSGMFSPRTIVDEHQDVEITFTVHGVGADRWQAQWVDGRVLSLLNDRVLVVPGRKCQKLVPAGGQGPTKDDDVTPAKWFTARRFSLFSVPKEA